MKENSPIGRTLPRMKIPLTLKQTNLQEVVYVWYSNFCKDKQMVKFY